MSSSARGCIADSSPEYDDIVFAEFEREHEIVTKLLSTDEFSSGEVIILSCPICKTPCKADGEHGLSCLPCGHSFGYFCIKSRLSFEKECPICNKKTEEKEIIRIRLYPHRQHGTKSVNV